MPGLLAAKADPGGPRGLDHGMPSRGSAPGVERLREVQRFVAVELAMRMSEKNRQDDRRRVHPAGRCASSETISPDFAWRPSFDFSKIGTSSRSTSNRPPLDGIRVISASGYRLRISAARPVARNS